MPRADAGIALDVEDLEEFGVTVGDVDWCAHDFVRVFHDLDDHGGNTKEIVGAVLNAFAGEVKPLRNGEGFDVSGEFGRREFGRVVGDLLVLEEIHRG